MPKLLIFICLLFFVQNDGAQFSWNENHKLKWTDFKGEPDLNSNAAAVTASGISFGYSVEKSSIKGITGFTTNISAHFYPEHSWCKKDLVDNAILEHEQYHFNITELNVRYFREEVAMLQASNNIVTALDIAHKKANANLANMQKRYDAESNYSINKEGQQQWIAYVNKELKRLEKYKSK